MAHRCNTMALISIPIQRFQMLPISTRQIPLPLHKPLITHQVLLLAAAAHSLLPATQALMASTIIPAILPILVPFLAQPVLPLPALLPSVAFQQAQQHMAFVKMQVATLSLVTDYNLPM